MKCVKREEFITEERDKDESNLIINGGVFFFNTKQNVHQRLKACRADEYYIAQFNIWRAITSRISKKWFRIVLMTLMMADRANEFHATYKSGKPFAIFNNPSHWIVC